jgi:alginate O-acetyltransferase complex protein AlgJ
MKLLVKLAAVAFVPIVFITFLLLLPVDQFGFRVWDSIGFKSFRAYTPTNFYPNISLERFEVGSLAPYTQHAVLKKVEWQTDATGFRNYGNHCDDPFIVIAGDSFAVGTAQTQSEMFSTLLEKSINKCVYSLAGVSIQEAMDVVIEKDLKPEYFFFINVEKNLGVMEEIRIPSSLKSKLIHSLKYATIHFPMMLEMFAYADRAFNLTFHAYKRSKGIASAVRRGFLEYDAIEDDIAKAPTIEKMLFLENEKSFKQYSEDQIDYMKNLVMSYNRYIKTYGIKFIFIPVPNKESVYKELLEAPFTDNHFIEAYITNLKLTGIKTVDIYTPCRKLFLENKTFCYHLDDDHWNTTGINVAIREGLKFIETKETLENSKV